MSRISYRIEEHGVVVLDDGEEVAAIAIDRVFGGGHRVEVYDADDRHVESVVLGRRAIEQAGS